MSVNASGTLNILSGALLTDIHNDDHFDEYRVRVVHVVG